MDDRKMKAAARAAACAAARALAPGASVILSGMLVAGFAWADSGAAPPSVAPAPAAAAGAPVKMAVPGYTWVKSLGGIDEYRLDSNGLTVLIAANHSAPVVTFQVTYRVGSRNEVTGTTGATHILEHLMFKGSDAFNDPKGNSIKQFLERVGGQFNASTAVDRTNYFATIGRDDLDGYVAIEADRMRHLWLHEADRQAEMTVVRNEYERGKNDPNNALMEEVTAAAYVALPYHHPTIGWKSDIEHVPIAKLREFYDTFYWPNNATVTVVGDVETAPILTLVKKYYGAYPHSPEPIPTIYTEEPAQTGARRVTVERPGELGSVVIAHKVPNGRDADEPVLEMLDAILSSGKTSRLYRALVDQGLALREQRLHEPVHHHPRQMRNQRHPQGRGPAVGAFRGGTKQFHASGNCRTCVPGRFRREKVRDGIRGHDDLVGAIRAGDNGANAIFDDGKLLATIQATKLDHDSITVPPW